MANVNRAIVMGRVGSDLKLGETKAGKPVVSFSIATSQKWNDKNTGERKEATEWHKIVLYGKTAEVAVEYSGKGQILYVEGKMQTRQWKDKDDNPRTTTELVGDKIEFISYKSSDTGTTKPKAKPLNIEIDTSFQTDDIPF